MTAIEDDLTRALRQPVVICEPDPTCKDQNVNRWHCMRGHSRDGETPTPGVCPLPVCERRGANERRTQ